jgi:glycogen operon protein
VLRRTTFLEGGTSETVLPDVWWFRPDGRRMTRRAWDDPDGRTLGVFLNGDGLDALDEHGEEIRDDSFVVLINANHEPVAFTLPSRRFGARWAVVLSTAEPQLPERDTLPPRATVSVPSRSLLLLRRAR